MRRRCRRSVCGDDFADVSDDQSLPSPPPPPPPVPEPQTSDCPVNDYLLKQGFGFKRDKLADCLRQLEDSELDVPQKAEFCIQKFLISDLNSWGCGILPIDLGLQTFLHGPYVLQVDEIINPSNPPERWYEESPPWIERRFLKLSMTDGIQTLYGIEFKRIDDLKVSAPPGLKVSISNVEVICGKLVLGPENTKILGGGLDESQLNKPSKEKSNGVLPLPTLATCDAWSSSRVGDLSHSGSILHDTDTVQASNQGDELNTMRRKREKRMRLLRRSASAAIDQPQLQICGDDFTDVSNDHSLPTPPPPPPVPKPQNSDCHVNDFLLKRGFGFNRDKLADCLRQLGDSGFTVHQKAAICIQKFRFSDLNSCGGGILPNDVDEISNASLPPHISRNEESVLMLSMTDGIQRVYGTVSKRIVVLDVSDPPGFKVSISNVEVIRGKLILGPENTRILGGGIVKQLDESNGVLPLPTLATCAARPSSRVMWDQCCTAHSGSMLHGTDTVQASNQVGAVSLADAPAFKKAPGGAPANVAGGFSESGGSSASRSKAKIFRFGSISLIDEPFKYPEFAALKVAEDPGGILKAKAVKNHITYIWELANIIKISKDDITFWTGGDVLNMLIHPKIMLLIVTEGSEGFIYHTKDFAGSIRGVDTTGDGDAFNYRILYSVASDPSICTNQKRLREVFKKVFANA